MIPPDPRQNPDVRPLPIIAVIDSCVFPRRDWLASIVRGAHDGYVVPIWTPLIIVEVTRLHTWRWLQQNGGDLSRAARHAHSIESKIWFTQMTSVFRVAEDCPPHEETWESPRDAWDVPIWSAAKRSGAQVIVTANLKDGPPEDEKGRRTFQSVLWCHPDVFSRLLERWADVAATVESLAQHDPDRTIPVQAILDVFDQVHG